MSDKRRRHVENRKRRKLSRWHQKRSSRKLRVRITEPRTPGEMERCLEAMFDPRMSLNRFHGHLP